MPALPLPPRARPLQTLALAALVLAAAMSAAAALEPRAVPAKPTLGEMEAVPSSDQVIVKFAEGLRVRIKDGRIYGLGAAEGRAFREALAASGATLAAVEPLHDASEATLEAERATGERESGRTLADLSLYYLVTVPAGKRPAVLANSLNALAFVEYAAPQPAPSPLPAMRTPPGRTPLFVREQGYRKPSPKGIGVFNPRRVKGGDGRHVTIADVEYSWQLNHEDLKIPESAYAGRPGKDPFNTDHGTAVLGELVGIDNAIGVTGLVPAAGIRLAPTITPQGFSIARAIGRATRVLDRGDVILIEQQAAVCGGQCGDDQIGCGPVEWNQAEFDAISTATALGITVVEAGGNGAVNLDAPACRGRFDRARRDSGAIIVGAGDPTTRARMSFSSYGSRVDVQAWGGSIWTTGYGDAFNPGPARRRYTSTFGGTSGASPMVTAAVAMVQSALIAQGYRPALPRKMRQVLTATGVPQRGPDHIGPLPDPQAALEKLERQGAAWSTATTEALAAAE